VSFAFGIRSSVGCGRLRRDHVALGLVEGNIGTRSRRTVGDWQRKPAANGSVDGFADGETASDRHGSASSRLRRGEYGLVWAGSSSNLANPLTKGPRGMSPTMSVKLPFLRALETNCTHLDTVPTRIKTWADVSKY
jgi:hypothetical protein